ncbi:type II toxin-antitoxin system MqsR family toxin [Legionella gresilensis]|uniref:type II toxin-antitoxin system MqsR family toxin n=1 Tax=Legionella gresilensis TaxID=91823 RepID=UPI001F5E80A0|nr:type II toxin-antitoxin system MqsR family toxin [Legionella gresilensis]
MNEKKQPAYNLRRIKQTFSREDKLVMTFSAKQGQIALGFTDTDVVNAIQSLKESDFYKSMAPHHPGFVAWQDVYKTRFEGVELYIKFQIGTRGELILSFKEK